MIEAIHGRCGDVITTPDGRVLSALSTAFDAVPGVDTLQLVQVTPDMLEVRVFPGPDWSEASQSEVLDTGQRALGAGMRLEVRLVKREDLVGAAAGKVRPVVGLVVADDRERN